MDEESLIKQLEAHWSLTGIHTERLTGGMNSIAYAVRRTATGHPTHVAKWVTAELVADLHAGCETARKLGAHGLVTGEPLPARDGRLTVPVDGGALALLRHVPGRELTGACDDERRQMGRTLGAVHAATSAAPRRGGFPGWLDPGRRETELVPWLASALTQVRAEFDDLPALTWATLHTDPEPGAFLLDIPTGRVGLIDWTGSCAGPVLYDVASAVMYLGGPDASDAFLGAHQSAVGLPPEELVHLDALRRFRWGVQASYFAGRLVRSDDTGLDTDPEGNEHGLEDARRGLESLGVPCPSRG